MLEWLYIGTYKCEYICLNAEILRSEYQSGLCVLKLLWNTLAAFDGLAGWATVCILSHPFVERFLCNPFPDGVYRLNVMLKYWCVCDSILCGGTKVPLCLIYCVLFTERLVGGFLKYNIIWGTMSSWSYNVNVVWRRW